MIRLASAGFVKINAYYAEGLSLLESIAMPSGKKEELKSFVCHLMNRKV